MFASFTYKVSTASDQSFMQTVQILFA